MTLLLLELIFIMESDMDQLKGDSIDLLAPQDHRKQINDQERGKLYLCILVILGVVFFGLIQSLLVANLISVSGPSVATAVETEPAPVVSESYPESRQKIKTSEALLAPEVEVNQQISDDEIVEKVVQSKIQQKQDTKSVYVAQKPKQLETNVPKINQLIVQKPKDSDTKAQQKCKQLQKYIKSITYYDINHFRRSPSLNTNPKIILIAQQFNKQQSSRQLLTLDKSPQEYENYIDSVSHPQCRPKQMPAHYSKKLGVTEEQFDLGYFMDKLMVFPDNPELLQAEFYRYDKLYSIGKYGQQLPICAVLVGKNNFKVIDRMYSSIARQNYTNFKIVHMDDNSNDGTVDKIVEYLKDKPRLQGRVTLVTQPYQRNSLYNRHIANSKFCGDEDIILDMDADDWLIGSQVFQLVNSLYQAGYKYKNQTNQLWSAYFTFIEKKKPCLPLAKLLGQIPEKLIKNQLYRTSMGQWRTTHLRTYLKKLYDKIDPSDFVDSLSRYQQFYVKRPDSFIQRSILQLSGVKHMRVLDEMVYFYVSAIDPPVLTDIYYAEAHSRAVVPYMPLQSLEDAPRRKPGYQLPSNIKNSMDKYDNLMKQRLEQYRRRIDSIRCE